MRKMWIWIALACLMAVGGAVAVFCRSSEADTDTGRNRPHKVKRVRKDKVHAVTNATGKVVGKVKKAHGKSKKKLTKLDLEARRRARLLREVAAENEIDPSLPPADRNAIKGIRGALRDENASAAMKYAEQLRGSASAEARSEAVRALDWFGDKAISGLTGFLSDSDESVSSEAMMAWGLALSKIEDDGMKLQYVEVAMSSIDDESMLDSIAMNLNQVADEGAAVETMIRIIEKGGAAGAAKAREAYEFMTGEEWSGKEAAMKWASEHHPEPEGDVEG